MKFFSGICKWINPTTGVALCALWLGGLGLIYWLTPYQPKAAWQRAVGEEVVGFLNDHRTLVSKETDGYFAEAAHFLNVETGQTRSIAMPEETYSIDVEPCRRALFIRERIDAITDLARSDVLRVLDPLSGKLKTEVAALDVWETSGNWYVSPDGNTALHINDFKVECYDLASRALLWTADRLAYPDSIPCFSDDGRLLATRHVRGIKVIDVRTGRTAASLNVTGPGLHDFTPVEFSPDGRMLVDGHGFVWDVTTGRLRFQTDPTGHARGNARFSADGKTILQAFSSPSCQLRYYDTASGREMTERSATVLRATVDSITLRWPAGNRRILCADACSTPYASTALEKLLALIPGFGWLRRPDEDHVYMLIDAESGQMITSGHDYAQALSGDGRYLITENKAGIRRLWELPLRTPWRTVVLWGCAWSVVPSAAGWLLRFRGRRPEEGAIDPNRTDTANGLPAHFDSPRSPQEV
jgi:hypothetical protein